MQPPYLFRINEIIERPNVVRKVDNRGNWIPSTDVGANILVSGGVSGQLWYCNGNQMQRVTTGAPQGAFPYKTFSMFYNGGHGFWVLEGDATNPASDKNWHPLNFDHDANDYSSYVANAGQRSTLRCQRADQRWPHMLLPDIYHSHTITQHQSYGGLTGDLPIFLALIAFSVPQSSLEQALPLLFFNGTWRAYAYPNGRSSGRGVVVHVYTSPSNWAGGSDAKQLERYEEGHYGKYFQ